MLFLHKPEWLNRWSRKKLDEPSESIRRDRYLLLEEIHKAHMEWTTAQYRFDYAVEKEQIDYAVYALEAAEKRFEMLLKQAKDMNVTAHDIRFGQA